MHCPLDCRMVVCAVLPLIVCVEVLYACVGVLYACVLCMYVYIFVGMCMHACCVYACVCVCVCVCAFMCGWVVYACYVCVWERERDTVSFHTTYLYISNYVLLLKETNNCNVCLTDTLVQVCWGTVQFGHLCCEVIPNLLFILGRKKMRILTAVLVFNKMNSDHQLFCYLWLAHVMTRWILYIHSQHIHRHTLTCMNTVM